MTRSLLASFLLALAACSSAPPPPSEVCGNGKDDDGNGKTDCDDGACAMDKACMKSDAGTDYGHCEKCGQPCATQNQCLDGGYLDDLPLPLCVAAVCQQKNTKLQVTLQYNTNAWAAFPAMIQSLNTRFISTTGVDGGTVNCAAVKAVATGKTEADAPQIEKSGLFNLRGYDVAPAGVSGGAQILEPFVNVSTGGDFFIWTEFWGGKPGTVTKLPTGNRLGYGCFESGPEVAPLVASDDCSSDGGTCRIIKLTMPGPQ